MRGVLSRLARSGSIAESLRPRDGLVQRLCRGLRPLTIKEVVEGDAEDIRDQAQAGRGHLLLHTLLDGADVRRVQTSERGEFSRG
jgi:hypothetical protein